MGRTGFGWLRIRSNGGFCELGDESSGSIKKAGFFDKLSDYQLFKYYPAPWSK
jgi:hypothetical protein